ncbi:DUF5996 family protein [Ramlibacter tataouinensis]|uniref:Ava_C0101 and related proteins n=1 Tax=Ramlibacter tataouinensis (strain ATCC BAA-407 / DSM 14655 / LMG 21543 / TTB310) TaxID=365046 RepID=F5XWB0_RAMTT|nr:DUF5996 family protein [Ramlibacter tataouinensis]AEG91680.1 Conserved hypothetical protein [Ramlibacter tataouinensis TTB310]
MTTWPALPLADWRDTLATLHMWTQVVGKTRLALAPMENHWWQCTLYVTERGLTTMPMPAGSHLLTVDFDFTDHLLVLRTADGARRQFPLAPRSVAQFYAQYIEAQRELGFAPRILARPVEVEPSIPFAEDEAHVAYDREAARRWWRALIQVDRVFKRFRSSFTGKQSPAHFFWGSFDLAVTRFSGRTAPRHPGGAPNCPDYVMVEAYSHECSSAGFWPGGGAVEEAAFYAYAYPEPEGYAGHPVRPAAAAYHAKAREFILPYEAVRTAADPDATLLEFLQSTYEAASSLGRWDRAALERRP